MAYKQRTVLICSGGGNKRHAFVVLNEPVGNPPQVMMLSFSTKRRNSDMTCVVNPDEHPWLTNESFIFYARPLEVFVRDLDKYVESGYYSEVDECPTPLFERIIGGIMESPRSVPFLKSFCENHL